MKYYTCLLLALVALCPTKPVNAIENQCQAAKVRQVATGIFVREGVHEQMTAENKGGIANISFVIGDIAVAVIDTGGSACDGQSLRAAIRARTALPIKYVINTHVHPDHIFGNAAFLQDKPQYIGHAKLKRAIAVRGKYYLTRFKELMGEETLAGTKLIVPTVEVTDYITLNLGKRVLKVTAHSTAHTDNDLTVFDEKTKTLWTGDLVFQGHLPVIDGKLLGWQKVLAKIELIRADRAIPGHGPASVRWPDGTDPQRRYFSVLAKDLRRFIADGALMQDAQHVAGISEKDNWELFEDFNPRNVSAGFAELEWE